MATPLQWHKKRSKVSMPYVAEIMLDLVNSNNPIKIMDLVTEAEKEGIGSRAHLHFNLTWLRHNSFVKVANPVGNNRIKEMTVSPKGLRYLELEQ